MEDIARKLYDLAEDGETVDSFDVFDALGLRPVWGCEGGIVSDSVADLAATLEVAAYAG